MARFTLAMILAAYLGLYQTTGILTHARYDHSAPSPGQVLNASPAEVEIFVAENMRKIAGANQISVAGPDGSQVDDGNSVVDDSNRQHLSVGLKPDLPSGRYVVSFKTLSDADGDADHGQFAFYVGTQPTPAQKAQDAKLALTADTEKSSTGPSTSLIIGAVIAAVVVLVLLGGGWTMLRRQRTLR